MRRVLVVILVMLGLLAWPGFGLAADEKPLCDVKFANPDQQAVAAVILDLENCYNTTKPEKLISLFTDDAQILTGMKGNRKGDWVTKKEYEQDILQSKMQRLAYHTVAIQYYKPSLCEVKNQAASVKLPFMAVWPHHNAWDKGFFEFNLVKLGDKWLIQKMYWKVTDAQKSLDYQRSDPDSVVF